jgi:hypothetical protein
MMNFWEYLEGITASGWVNTVIAGILQEKDFISTRINSLTQIFGVACPQGNYSILWADKVSDVSSPNICLYICYRGIDQITLQNNLITFAANQTAKERHLFVFEPTPFLINQGMGDVLVYSIENGQLKKW